MGRSPYQRALERDCERARERAEVFFWRLLAESNKLPKAKLLMKAPAALAACYALMTLQDCSETQEPSVMVAVVSTTLKLFDAEVERARGTKKRGRNG